MSSKNSVESVRYHLKKNGGNASNSTISSYLERHPSAAPKELADIILAGETTALEPAAAAAPAPLAVVTEKQELAVKTIAAQEFSLALTTNDVADIVNALNPAISDELEFLAQVKGAIALWLQDRRDKTSAAIAQELADIADLINQDNANVSSIFDTANHQIKELVSRQKTRQTDYKSKDRRDIFEMLKPA